MASSAVNLGTCAVPGPQERRCCSPVVGCALGVEGRGLADAQRVRYLVHGRAFGHVRSVGAESDVAVVVAVSRGDARLYHAESVAIAIESRGADKWNALLSGLVRLSEPNTPKAGGNTTQRSRRRGSTKRAQAGLTSY